MAKRRSSAGGSSRARSTKATSRRAPKPAPARAAEVEVVEEEAGEGIDTGILVITFVALFAALLFVDKLLGNYGQGMFF